MEQELKTTPPETQVCKCCGRELPVEEFRFIGTGEHRNRLRTCNACCGKKSSATRKGKKVNELDDLRRQLQEARTLRLRDFQPRELMIELKHRGYEGTLTYTEVRTIDITKVD